MEARNEINQMLWYLIWLQVRPHYCRFSFDAGSLSQEDSRLQTLTSLCEAMNDSTQSKHRTTEASRHLLPQRHFGIRWEKKERREGRWEGRKGGRIPVLFFFYDSLLRDLDYWTLSSVLWREGSGKQDSQVLHWNKASSGILQEFSPSVSPFCYWDDLLLGWPTFWSYRHCSKVLKGQFWWSLWCSVSSLYTCLYLK